MATGQQPQIQREQILAYMMLNRWEGTTYPVLAIGGTTSKFKTTNALVITKDGAAVASLANGDWSLAVPAGYAPGYASQVFVPPNLSQVGGLNTPWPTSLAQIPVSSWQRLLIVTDGTTVYSLPSFIGLASAAAAPDAPPVPAGYVAVGDITIKTDATHAFTFGTTVLSAAGITAAYRDFRWPDTGPSAFAAKVGFAANANVA